MTAYKNRNNPALQKPVVPEHDPEDDYEEADEEEDD